MQIYVLADLSPTPEMAVHVESLHLTLPSAISRLIPSTRTIFFTMF